MSGLIRPYLTFAGRISRVQYWKLSLRLLIAVLICLGVFLAISSKRFAGDFPMPVRMIGVGVITLFWLASLAVAVRRLHDRNKSGWWILPFYVLPQVAFALVQSRPETPLNLGIVGVASLASLWGMIEIGFLKGSRGPNKFGDDPLL